MTHRADADELVAVVHHGDEKVEQHDDVDHGEAAEHDEGPEPGELLDPGQLEVVQVDQAKSRPEESLTSFPEADNFKRVSVLVGKWWNINNILAKASEGKTRHWTLKNFPP